MEPTEQKLDVAEKTEDLSFDFSKDVVLTDESGDRIAAMREYVFLNVVSAVN